MIFNLDKSINISFTLQNSKDVELFIKREDKIHSIISGNKFRKLKYNIEAAKLNNKKTLLTFGGAFSNHIAAVAESGRLFNFKTIGIIRGEELITKINDNPTLKFAQDCGMQFKFVNRSDFKNKDNVTFKKALQKEFGNYYSIPEGGTNRLAIKGCGEILTAKDLYFDYICASVGTGGTLAGLINCSKPSQQVLGFSALKGDFLKEDISKFAMQENWTLISDYHFGGYAKINTELIAFINAFKLKNKIQLDPIYTGKMLFGIQDMINKNYFPKGSKLLVIHTGGIQGIAGMNKKLKLKNLPLITI